MKFQSNFIENLRLLLKGKYIVSDEDLRFLSDTIFSFGLEDVAERGILFNLIHFMRHNNLTFPISYNFMRTLWEKKFLSVSFSNTLQTLVDSKLVSLRRVSEDTFNQPNITKNPEEFGGEDKYLVVYGTSLYKEFNDYLKENNLLQDTYQDGGRILVSEGVSIKNLDKKYANFIKSTITLIKGKLHIPFEIESYDYDNIRNTIEFNFLCTIPKLDEYKIKNHVMLRKFKKHLKHNDVLDREIYIDGKETVFLSTSIDMRILQKDLSLISKGIYYTLEAILDEINFGGR